MIQSGLKSETLCVSASHPALSGHFPGNPLVPGVVFLAGVIAAAECLFEGRVRITGMPSVKFLTPVRPDQEVLLMLMPAAAGLLKFECRLGESLVATGGMEMEAHTQSEKEQQ
jgi:3-hydroxymyristoyl/3-hydroxydecanoyl-(acyl carrier protein) dehydratase